MKYVSGNRFWSAILVSISLLACNGEEDGANSAAAPGAAETAAAQTPVLAAEGARQMQQDFNGQDLNGADMRQQDLKGADFSGADLSYADLSESDVKDAIWVETLMNGTDVSAAFNFDLPAAYADGAIFNEQTRLPAHYQTPKAKMAAIKTAIVHFIVPERKALKKQVRQLRQARRQLKAEFKAAPRSERRAIKAEFKQLRAQLQAVKVKTRYWRKQQKRLVSKLRQMMRNERDAKS